MMANQYFMKGDKVKFRLNTRKWGQLLYTVMGVNHSEVFLEGYKYLGIRAGRLMLVDEKGTRIEVPPYIDGIDDSRTDDDEYDD